MTQHPNGDYVEESTPSADAIFADLAEVAHLLLVDHVEDIEFSNVYEDEEYGACALSEEDQRTIHRLIQTASKHIRVDWSAVRKELGL